jgi:hypothetical protein
MLIMMKKNQTLIIMMKILKIEINVHNKLLIKQLTILYKLKITVIIII